jgi:hypothetical protein
MPEKGDRNGLLLVLNVSVNYPFITFQIFTITHYSRLEVIGVN